MPGLLVDPHHGILARSLGQAEDLPRGWIGPRFDEPYSLVALEVLVAPVRLQQLLVSDTVKATMHVHELGHGLVSFCHSQWLLRPSRTGGQAGKGGKRTVGKYK